MLSDSARKFLNLLSDGAWHSGEDLGRTLSVSRASISKHCKQLRDLGLEIESQVGQGYRLARPVSLLDAEIIRSNLRSELGAESLHVVASLGSTNTFLMDRARNQGAHAEVCLAEMQTAGRGRRGRQWASPFASNIYLSLAWCFDEGIAAVEGLSLAVGLEVCRALEDAGFNEARLKWPNDVLVGQQKLGGVLVELAGDADGECTVVAGVGLNVQSVSSMEKDIDQPWTSLSDHDFLIDRNALSAGLLNRLIPLLESFPQKKFAAYQDDWEQRNAFSGQQISLSGIGNGVSGRMIGVDSRGSIVVDVNGRSETFVGGELSLRQAG